MKNRFEIRFKEELLGRYPTFRKAQDALRRFESRKREFAITGIVELVDKLQTPDPTDWTKENVTQRLTHV